MVHTVEGPPIQALCPPYLKSVELEGIVSEEPYVVGKSTCIPLDITKATLLKTFPEAIKNFFPHEYLNRYMENLRKSREIHYMFGHLETISLGDTVVVCTDISAGFSAEPVVAYKIEVSDSHGKKKEAHEIFIPEVSEYHQVF